MGKRNRIKRPFRDLSDPSKNTLASGSASTASGTALEPRPNEPTERASGAFRTNRSQDASDKDLWGLALEQLSVEDKEAVSQILSDSKLDILRHLHTAALKKQTKCDDKRWRFEINGRQIILRDIAQKTIAWIDKFKQIGDIAVNFDPVHASLPWAGIRFLLEMSVTESQQMGALLTGVEKMASLIGRCQIYEILYLGGQPSEQEEWKQAATNLTSALVALYATMLSFLASAIRAYDQGTIIRTLHAILSPAKVIGFLQECQSLENIVAIEVDNCERMHTRRTQITSEKQIQKLEQLLADLQTPILRIDSGVTALCQRLDGSERLSILEWISGIRYEENHFFARQGRTSGTGEWLLRHGKYREWRASSASVILWLHGAPGSGKTKLVSTVVDDLLETFKQLPNDEAFAYFYCDRNQHDRQDPSLILSSFVRQLSTSRSNDAIPRSTVQMYNQKRHTGFASGKLKLEESCAVLADLLEIYPQITLVVDALDECDKKIRLDFMDVLDKLIAESSKPVKILISSRRDEDIKHHFEDGPNLEIKSINNRADIAMFVHHEFTASEKFWRFGISSELKDLICNTLIDRSEGMFQWVSLQIIALRELRRERDIRNRLGKLPKTLKIAYDELYLKIQSQEESTPIIAIRAFQWVMCSYWPLSPAELVAAVCQDPDTDEIEQVDINIDIILDACQNLLVVDQKLNFLGSMDQSSLAYQNWHEMARKCLDSRPRWHYGSSLSEVYPQLSPCSRASLAIAGFGFHKTIPEWWTTGFADVNEKNSSGNSLLLLGAMRGSVSIAEELLKKGAEVNMSSREYGSAYGSALQAASFYGHESVVRLLLDKGADANTLGGKYGSALQAASSSGHELIVRLLLEKEADVNVSGGIFGNALQAASFFNRKSVVRLLLDKGAEVNESRGVYGGALQVASSRGLAPLVQLLLDKGADVNTSGGTYGNALQAASFFNHEPVVQLLLGQGAYVKASGGEYGSALQAASYHGDKVVVRLLLDMGANVNASGGKYGSALQAASFRGHESLVQLLLDEGADINASGAYGNALQAASSRGYASVVQTLLDKRADVNSSGGEYGSALQAASFYGYVPLVQLLLNKGADVNLSSGTYGSALQAASFSGHESIVLLLLEKGADIHTPGGEYGNALQAASFFNHESIVQLLLTKGADINASGGECGSALQAASFKGHESVVQLLLNNGADVNASGGTYGSALQAASSEGHESVVQLLLDKRADPNASGGEYGNALYAASFFNHESIVQLLLAKGADINAPGGEYGNALFAASFFNHESIVQLLLAKGADVNASGGKYGSALHAASYYGHEVVVRLLLDRGADLHTLSGKYGNALQAASRSNHESVVQLLLDREADPNSSGREYDSALEAASKKDHLSVVRLLEAAMKPQEMP